ncbi:GvpL/GvpF family gas vesicle protein [Streptomyces sp. 6N223]|uniref:GvpL/GvpF family gas vesicle protein n=1 Tax=Streptomyces sp. 6N223 TaxID=3457412 RepID=UPI003FCF4737
MSTYVYGIAGAAARHLPEGLAGIGDPPRPVRVISARDGHDTAAIVSDCPSGLRPKRRDLFAHQRVLAAATDLGPVLPLRFGSVSPDDTTVRAAIDAHADQYSEQLRAVAGRAEYNVKAGHRQTEVLRLVLAGDPEIRALNEATRTGPAGAHQRRLRLGALVAQAVRNHEASDAAALEAALAPHAERVHRGPGAAALVTNLSFLVEDGAAGDFLAAVEGLREARPHLDLRVSGPLPPYSFVWTAPGEA